MWHIDPLLSSDYVNSGPFLGNGSVHTFLFLSSRFLIMQQLDYNNKNRVFSTWSVPRCYKQETKSVKWQFCEGRTGTREAEGSPLLETATRERLVKTNKAGKGSAGAVVICELWRLAMAL
jgi:hypothetical protein